MKQIIIYFLTILTITSSCSSCKKNSDNPIAEIDKLPPITQEGKNTFGCLVNGVAFTPSTPKPLKKPTLKCYYDPTYGGGTINLSATNKLANSNSVSISINAFGINEVGIFPVGYFTAINVPKRVTIDYDNTVTLCSFTSYSLAPQV